MSEPREIADHAEPVVDGVWHWRISNSNLGGATSSSQAISADAGTVLIDPVQLAPSELAGLREPTAIVLTAKCHQRSAWRYRSEFGAEVWAPAGAPDADEEPDHRYGDGDLLPGGLRAVHTPGPEPGALLPAAGASSRGAVLLRPADGRWWCAAPGAR